MKPVRTTRVAFGDERIRGAFLELKSGKFEEKDLAKHIQKAIDRLKEDPFIGIVEPRRLWPKEYIVKFSINNLRKFNLPGGWRLMYTIRGDEVEIVSIILEWLSHHEYERRFKYRQS